MRIEYVCILTEDEIPQELGARYIAEHALGNHWKTGRFIRIREEMLKDEPENRISTIIATAKRWYTLGCPREYRCTPAEYMAWQKMLRACLMYDCKLNETE